MKDEVLHKIRFSDGKHIRIMKPNLAGSEFFNYKHFNSIVLMAVADSNYRFVWAEIGVRLPPWYGSDPHRRQKEANFYRFQFFKIFVRPIIKT